jgi:alpha-galactosidase
MGWSAWNLYGETVTGENVRKQAQWLVETGLADYGYTYVLLDDTWQGRRDGQTGELPPNRRMGDIKSLADFLHAKGLKLGIYSSPNQETCAGYTGSANHEEQDAKTWAAWGVDYLKYDWCDQNTGRRDATPALLKPMFDKMRTALDKTDRDIVYSITTYGLASPWEWGRDSGANVWWTSGQIVESWESVSRAAQGLNSRNDNTGPGGWGDPGWLYIGKVGSATINPHFTKLTPDEQKAQFTMWCMVSAPLILSNDLTQLDPNAFFPVTRAIITNDEAIAINQDPLGKPGAPFDGSFAGEIWSRKLADGTVAVALFNRQNYPRKITAVWKELGLTGPQAVRDIWRRKDLGKFDTDFGAEVPAHGVVFLKVGKP